MKKENIESIIWIFCIIVMLFLTVKVNLDAEELSCNKCVIEFKDKTVVEKQYSVAFEKRVDEMFYYWHKEQKCIVDWDPVQGFVNLGGGWGEK